MRERRSGGVARGKWALFIALLGALAIAALGPEASAVGAATGTPTTGRFTLTMQGNGHTWDLGTWTKVTGLDVNWDVSDPRTGGALGSLKNIPGNTKYSKVTLSRPAAATQAQVTKQWLKANPPSSDIGFTATITLHAADGTAQMSWELRDAMPTKWAIVSFDANGSQVAMEEFVLQHKGFLSGTTAP